MVRSRENKDSSAPLQNFDIICSTSWANRDKCCELPGLRGQRRSWGTGPGVRLLGGDIAFCFSFVFFFTISLIH
ncbi:hypothetical protein XENOCAPTIV_023930 [Xenoophorus captivus]|uniref:Uncharacterized protein n=1 Tax=Xenoophorus captivus TaxID=1517983 RepID=A0ABV0Q6S8_9TELE